MLGREPYARVVRRALHTVPHYRERFAATGTLPPLSRDDVGSRLHLLMPLGAALLPRRDPGRLAAERVAELREALGLAGHRIDGRPVYEVTQALRDPVRAHGTHWRVLLGPGAETDPYVSRETSAVVSRETSLPLPGGPALVVGDAGELAAVLGSGAPGGLVAVERMNLTAAATAAAAPSDAASDRPPGGSLWYEPWLGYLGAVPVDCGDLHLNTRRVHARLLDGGTVLTLLKRRRPTLVHVRPEGGELFRPERCPRHGSPILRRTR